MVFSSLLFLFRFLPTVLAVYYVVPRRFRNAVLFIFSLIFYAWGEPVYIILMLVSILVSYISGILLQKFTRSSTILIISCVFSLSMLAFFKYSRFPLPVGISFYTFQTLSYVIDVYRGDAKVQKNFISFGAYVSMFPQLIAGPIVRYKTIDAQLRNRTETLGKFSEGVHRFVVGLGKKVLLANNIGMLWDTIRGCEYSALPLLTAWLGITAYTFQIYFDFSGYSDMAVGLGLMFGFRFTENFNYPYTAKSITEFWRRWHISLGAWFREYVYIPLGGNRTNTRRNICNILIVWLLTGIWHGASWNFVIWGLYYGVLLTAEKFIWGKWLNELPSVIQHCYCMFFVIIGWSLFAFDDIGNGIEFLQSMFSLNGREFLNRNTLFLLMNNATLLIMCVIGSMKLSVRLSRSMMTLSHVVIFMLSVAWLVDETFNPFLYFRF